MGAERSLVEALATPDQATLGRLQAAAQDIFPAYQAAHWRLRAELYVGAGDITRATQALDKALALCQRWDFPLEEGLALATLARLKKSESLLGRARDRLAQAGAGPIWEARIEKWLMADSTGRG
jgi:hypothetical protein